MGHLARIYISRRLTSIEAPQGWQPGNNSIAIALLVCSPFAVNERIGGLCLFLGRMRVALRPNFFVDLLTLKEWLVILFGKRRGHLILMMILSFDADQNVLGVLHTTPLAQKFELLDLLSLRYMLLVFGSYHFG